MKNKILRFTSVLLVHLLFSFLLLSSCARQPPDYFAYTEQAATMEMDGTLFGKSFVAKVTLTPNVSGWWATVEYLKLPAWEGLRVEAQFDANGQATQDALLTFGDLSRTQAASLTSGLLAPVAVLLDAHEPTAVSYREDVYTLTLENGATMAVNKEGIPIRYSGNSVDFWIVWWENSEKKN